MMWIWRRKPKKERPRRVDTKGLEQWKRNYAHQVPILREWAGELRQQILDEGRGVPEGTDPATSEYFGLLGEVRWAESYIDDGQKCGEQGDWMTGSGFLYSAHEVLSEVREELKRQAGVFGDEALVLIEGEGAWWKRTK